MALALRQGHFPLNKIFNVLPQTGEGNNFITFLTSEILQSNTGETQYFLLLIASLGNVC